MAFCPNCGTVIADGDKFCGNCGTVVTPAQDTSTAPQENVQPNFQQNVQPNFQQNVQQNYQPNFQQNIQSNLGTAYNQQYMPQAPSQFGIAIEQIGKEFVNFVKDPVGTITKGKFEMSAMASYILAGFMALLLVLQNFWSAAAFGVKYSSIGNYLNLGDLEDLFGLGSKSSKVGLPYGKIFLTSLFFVILMLAAVWGISLLINVVIMKGQFTTVHAMNVVSFAAVPYFACALLGTILGYADGNIGHMIYLAGIFGAMILFYKALGSSINKPEVVLFYSFMAAVVVLYFINFIIFKVAGPKVSFFYHGIFMGIM